MKSILPLTFAVAAVAYPTSQKHEASYLVSLGPRPYYIINNMTDGPLKYKLQSCENKPVSISDFSIGHRGGGTLQFPEETVQSEEAGARMGAGILECDVSFTSDRGLVCRHSLCDLQTTTDILLRPELAKKCSQPFTPANSTAPANALCCTSDITIAECMFAFMCYDPIDALTSNSQHTLRQTRWLQCFCCHTPGISSRNP
jgi:glycerophosphoryl diester phosphodiesterase